LVQREYLVVVKTRRLRISRMMATRRTVQTTNQTRQGELLSRKGKEEGKKEGDIKGLREVVKVENTHRNGGLLGGKPGPSYLARGGEGSAAQEEARWGDARVRSRW